MGHYLSDMESDREFRIRVVLRPMAEVWRKFDKERKRGIMHTPEWTAKMAEDEEVLRAEGWLD